MDIINRIREEIDSHTYRTGKNYISKSELDFILLRVSMENENERMVKMSENMKKVNNALDNLREDVKLNSKNTDNKFLNLIIKS